MGLPGGRGRPKESRMHNIARSREGDGSCPGAPHPSSLTPLPVDLGRPGSPPLPRTLSLPCYRLAAIRFDRVASSSEAVRVCTTYGRMNVSDSAAFLLESTTQRSATSSVHRKSLHTKPTSLRSATDSHNPIRAHETYIIYTPPVEHLPERVHSHYKNALAYKNL